MHPAVPLLLCLALLPDAAPPAPPQANSPVVTVDPASVQLTGPNATFSLLVTARQAGQLVDRTRAARYVSHDPAIVRVNDRGQLHALRDGRTTITVTADGVSCQVVVVVKDSARLHDYHFGNDIVPLLSRFGCNSSGCHGKAEGQNGFKLSVFGFDPAADYASLVKEGRGRRVFPAAPDMSLLLRKMSGQSPHGGGARIRAGSREYDTIRGWIAVGMPFGSTNAPHVVRVRVEPAERQLEVRATQQLRVLATYSDGRVVDVTAHARFSSNNDVLANVDADGLVTAGDVPGEAAIMASFMNELAVFRVLVPRRQRIARYPDLPEHNFIDCHVHAKLKKLHILPSGVCDDATFLRRVFLDVIGTLPTAAEARRFLLDRRSDKRTRLVEELLARPEFADYWAMKWADLLRVDRAALGAKQARAYHRWIRTQVANNTPLDRFARELIIAEGPLNEIASAAFFKAVKRPGDQASTLAQVFLGVRIACAECHHHPFDRWSQSDYHGMAAFFTGLRLERAPTAEAVNVTGISLARHPRTGETILAHVLGSKAPARREPGDSRGELASWLTNPKNPWFARNLANRVWAHFLGRGLIEPVDDVRDTNPPTNPELLDALAKHLIDGRYDLKVLIRAITASRTYQLSTAPNETNAGDSLNYSRSLLRRVPAEVLLDMVSQVTGVPERFGGAEVGTRAIQLWDSQVPHYFLKAYGRTERTSACECERNAEPSVAQVLHLMNAPQIEEKLSHAAGKVAKLVKKCAEDGALVEELYLAFFSRMPDDGERKTGVDYLNKKRPNRREAAEDLAWGMLNAIEFAFNH
jgi:hypothetical protein